MNPVIITCAITGAETTREKQPSLPVTPEQQAQAAAECVKAGASIIHLHVREDDGKPSQRTERFEESIRLIRKAAPGVIIQISTGGAVGESIENRARPLSLKPEMASLNLGTMNFGEDVFMNHPRDIVALAARMQKNSVVPELEIYEAGMLESAFRLAKQGVLREPLHFQFVLGVSGGMSGDPRNLVHLVTLLEAGAAGRPLHWGVAGVGRFQLPLAVQALVMGGHVRVGFEDNIFYQKGVLATSNAQLVERVARIAGELGREVATPAVAREILGLSS
ncbi:MAG: 3-keto-5-aminohexanoate cleavage protein [Oligoflexia bacterium]|nr:3-keto-5-aminohexanoate cleavage protein [Oligoflexia bacterium]